MSDPVYFVGQPISSFHHTHLSYFYLLLNFYLQTLNPSKISTNMPCREYYRCRDTCMRSFEHVTSICLVTITLIDSTRKISCVQNLKWQYGCITSHD